MKTINIPTENGLIIAPIESIIRIEALNNYSRIIFINRKPLVVAKVLHWFQDRLPQTLFYRIHKSHLVNSCYIAKMKISWSGSAVFLCNGETITVSRRKRLLLSNCEMQILAGKAA